jgi:hypothetical protein
MGAQYSLYSRHTRFDFDVLLDTTKTLDVRRKQTKRHSYIPQLDNV